MSSDMTGISILVVTHNIEGKPLIDHTIEFWQQVANRFLFVVNYRKEMIINHVTEMNTNVAFVVQPALRGIAHALLCCEPWLPERFIVILGDCFCRGSFDFPKSMQLGYGVQVGASPEAISRSYSIKVHDCRIVDVAEKPENPPNNMLGMGYYFFDRSIFRHIQNTPPSALRNEIEITDAIQNAIQADESFAPVWFSGEYINLNYAKDLDLVEHKSENPQGE